MVRQAVLHREALRQRQEGLAKVSTMNTGEWIAKVRRSTYPCLEALTFLEVLHSREDRCNLSLS